VPPPLHTHVILLFFILFRTLFASSVLNLCELLSLRGDLKELHKVLYFHENQLVYPVRKQLERDFQYGYNQILSWYEVKVDCVRTESHIVYCTLSSAHMYMITGTHTHTHSQLTHCVAYMCYAYFYFRLLYILLHSELPVIVTSFLEF